MLHSVARIAFASLLMSASWPALAQSAGWSIAEVSGSVMVQRGAEKVFAKRGASLGGGDIVITGANGRAVLVHNKDFVTVAANSRVRTPTPQSGSTMTRFFQDLGTAIFRIEKRGTPHFSVDTPYLAAVVKGTTFSVTVGAADTSLQVTEGLVEVATIDGGARSFIRPGAIAMIAATDRYRLTVAGDQPQVLDSPLRAGASTVSVPVEATAAPGAAPIAGESVLQTQPTDGEWTAQGTPPEIGKNEAGLVTVTVASKPADLGKATGGMVVGDTAVVFASLAATTMPLAKTAPASDARELGTAQKPSDSAALVAGGSATAPSEDIGKEALADTATAPERTETPVSIEPPVKAENPGKEENLEKDADASTSDKPSKDDDAGKGDKPGKDDDAGKVDKPGKDDDAGKVDKPTKDDDADKGDKPGKGEDAGKDDDAGKGDKPGKDDDAGKVDKPGKDGRPGKDGSPGKSEQDEVRGPGVKPGRSDDGDRGNSRGGNNKGHD